MLRVQNTHAFVPEYSYMHTNTLPLSLSRYIMIEDIAHIPHKVDERVLERPLPNGLVKVLEA